MFRSRHALIVTALGVGCIPYSVGQTAHPLPGETMERSLAWYFIPNGIEIFDSSATLMGMDFEIRRGLNDGASDIGLRIPMLSGAVVTYKRRLTSAPVAGEGAAVALLVGAGIVNLGQHAHGEIAILASGREEAQIVPYGGLRAMQVVPISTDAVSDSPTAGGFFGLRFGRRDAGISIEVAVYYDRSALEIRSGNVIVVPSIVLHGDEFVRMLRGGRRH